MMMCSFAHDEYIDEEYGLCVTNSVLRTLCYMSYPKPIHRVAGYGAATLVGSLKLQVSFAEYRLFYGALLQQRRIILRSLLIEARPYQCVRINCAYRCVLGYVC